MTYRGLVLLGCGGHARSVADVALDLGVAELMFIDAHGRDGERIAGFPVLRTWPNIADAAWAAFPASGAAKERQLAVQSIRQRGVQLATLVSRRAYVGHCAVIGEGTLIAHGAHVGPFARIGDGVIINTSALVDHESTVGDYAHVAVNATVAGRCAVGRNTLIGAGAVVIDGVVIGDDVSVGAGAVVVADLRAPGVYVGVPARAVGPTS